MSGEKKDTSSLSLELMIPHNDPIGVPSNSNLITITAHGARHGDKIIKIPDNVYIISPCSDDLSWSRYYWLGSNEDQIKACNKLDYEDLGGALDDRCLVEQLSRFEKMALYSNKGNLFERYPVETIRRNHLDRAIENIADGKKDDRAQWNSLIRNTTDKALHYIFPSLTKGADMNVIFQDICRTGSNFKTDQCSRFCVNGPGTYVKNQEYSGSYQPTERVYGSKVRYFKNSTGEKVEVILRGRLNDEKKKVDPEGYKKVEQAMASAGPELTEKIINRISLEDILFYYKNFGINAFKKSNEPVMSRDKPNTNIVNKEPLIIFLGDPCRADRLLGLGVEEKYFIDFSKIKSDEQYRKIIREFRDWFNDSHIRIGMSNTISIDYLPENLSKTAYISGLSAISGAWKRDIQNQNITIIQKKLSPRPTSLRSSTNITTDHVTVKGPNSHLYNDTHEILLESPCSRTRPRLNEYMRDVRSRETRSMRNITSNDIARNEIFLCEQLKKLGLGVGSRLAIVLKLSENPPREELESDSSSPNLLSSSIANNRSNIIFLDKKSDETTLAENYLSIRDKYDFTYFTGKSRELVEIRNKKKSQSLRQTRKKRRTKSRKNKTITFRYRDYPQWDCVIFTEIRGIENNALVLGIKSSNNYRENLIEGSQENLHLCFKALINEFNIPPRNLNYFMYTNYGDIGFQSHSLFNINPDILNFCYWDIDSKLTDSFVDGEKNINRSKVYKDLLDRNIKSRRYKGDPELQNIELSAYRDRMVRETNQPLEQLSKVPDLFDYEVWKCNKFIKNDDGRWEPCNAINHEEEEDCYKCGQDKWSPPIRKSTDMPPRISLRTSAARRSTYMKPTLEELKQSGIDLSTVVNKTSEEDDTGSVEYGHVRQLMPNIPPPIRSIHSESKRGGKRKNKKTRRKLKKSTKKKTRSKRRLKKRRRKTRK